MNGAEEEARNGPKKNIMKSNNQFHGILRIFP